MLNEELPHNIKGQRTLAAILFTDAVSFSARMSDLAPLPGGDGGGLGLLSTQGQDITSHKTSVRVSLAEESRVVP